MATKYVCVGELPYALETEEDQKKAKAAMEDWGWVTLPVYLSPLPVEKVRAGEFDPDSYHAGEMFTR